MAALKERNVLIVDDDAIDVKALRRAFLRVGWDGALDSASNGREALEYITQRQQEGGKLPQLVVLDINMPLMNGLEFLRALRENDIPAFVPIVMLTTSCEDYVVKQAYSLGAVGFFEKPRGLDGLQEIVDTIADYWKCSRMPDSTHAPA
jgi:CheY-like chemotaxis protein